jgi:hypothetical protein
LKKSEKIDVLRKTVKYVRSYGLPKPLHDALTDALAKTK